MSLPIQCQPVDFFGVRPYSAGVPKAKRPPIDSARWMRDPKTGEDFLECILLMHLTQEELAVLELHARDTGITSVAESINAALQVGITTLQDVYAARRQFQRK